MTNHKEMLKASDAITSIEQAYAGVNKQLEITLGKAPRGIRAYTKHLLLSQGKGIRARCLLACAQENDGSLHPNAVRFAAAIELLHLATLVHDDVIDDAPTRRGVQTLQSKFGKKTAVICGDYLLCEALRLAASVKNRQDYVNLKLPGYVSRVCLGELRQGANQRNLRLSSYEYLRIISGKTAALFEAACYGGAILCESAKNDHNRYCRLGRYMGMIFQIMDDCLDFEATEEDAKKPVQSDYEQGVITLPLIYAFSKDSDFRQKAASNEVQRCEINQTVFKTGGLGYSRGISQKYYQKALRQIQELEAEDFKKEHLSALLKKAYDGLKASKKHAG